MFSDEVNMGYEDMLWEIVSRVNGKGILPYSSLWVCTGYSWFRVY